MTPKARRKKTSPKKAPKKIAVKAHLLVVDDEADFAKMIQKTLVQAGYHVDAATSATQAPAGSLSEYLSELEFRL